MTAVAVTLPNPLPYMETPNMSVRSGVNPYLIVIHRPVGKYGPSISWLRNPKSRASCHVITEGNGSGVDVATQLVPWHMKAWACEAFNSASYNLEIDDDAWDGDDMRSFYTAARISAFIHVKTRIPVVYTKKPTHNAGIIFHIDLGAAGGGHSDPTSDPVMKRAFVRAVQKQVDIGGFRRTWGRGRFVKI